MGTICCNTVSSRLILHKLITDNMKYNTGFLMFMSNFGSSCIFQHSKRGCKYHLIVFGANGDTKILKNIHDIDSLIETFFYTVKEQFCSKEIEHCIKFLSCSSNLSNDMRQKVKRKHSSHGKKHLDAKRKKKSCVELDAKEKQKVLSDRVKRYKVAKIAKTDKNEQSQNWYTLLDSAQKDKLLTDRAAWYRSLNPAEKQKLLSSIRANTRVLKLVKESEATDLYKCISVFKNKIRDGPNFICAVCNRLLYRKTVMCLNKEKYKMQGLFTNTKSFDNKEYICRTCHSKAVQGKVPSQAVCNKLEVFDIPPELSILKKLEQIFIAQRIVFQKVVVMPKGQQRKIKGTVCNVPVDCVQHCNILPRPQEISGIIMLKLKRKIKFRGHVYFQAVRPEVIVHVLNWLRNNNPLYSNVEINLSNIDNSLTTMHQNENISESDVSLGDETEI